GEGRDSQSSPSRRCAHRGGNRRRLSRPDAQRVSKWMPGMSVARILRVRWEAQRHTAFFCEKASARKSAVVTSLCRRSPKCALLRRKLQLISPHVFTCHAVAACSNASTRFSRHVFRDREHSPSSASLQG